MSDQDSLYYCRHQMLEDANEKSSRTEWFHRKSSEYTFKQTAALSGCIRARLPRRVRRSWSKWTIPRHIISVWLPKLNTSSGTCTTYWQSICFTSHTWFYQTSRVVAYKPFSCRWDWKHSFLVILLGCSAGRSKKCAYAYGSDRARVSLRLRPWSSRRFAATSAVYRAVDSATQHPRVISIPPISRSYLY